MSLRHGILLVSLTLAATPASALGPRKPAGACSDLSSKDIDRILRLIDEDARHERAWSSLEKKVEAAARSCGAEAEPALAGCLDNLWNFVSNQRLTRSKGHSMGFRLSNAEYLARQPKEMISFPKELADGLPANWRQVCAEKGWDCLEFVSKSLPNPPRMNFKRVLVREPGDRFERWMLFTVPSKGTAERLIDFMAVEKARVHPGTGELIPLQRPRLHFVEYWRDAKGKNPVFRGNIAACYKCHPSGMRDIVPAPGSTDAAGLETAKKLNQWMREHRPFDWGEGTVVPEHYGPPMGERQTCTKCHNGEYRGVLNAAHLGERSRHQIYFKMVQDLTMPPGHAKNEEYKPLFDAFAKAALLTPAERARLYPVNTLASVDELINLGLGGDKGPMAASNRKVLKFLRKRGYITESEREEALRALERLEDRMKAEYRQMKADYRVELAEWLKGGRAECATLFK